MGGSSSRKRVLVVDDESDLRELVSYNLRKDGFDVSEAADGEEALREIRRGGIDLVVLDLMLPGVQGTELCSILRENSSTSTIPVIMLTAKSDEADKVTGLAIGADDYVTKPFSPRELIARINAVLRRTGREVVKEATLNVGDLEIDTERFIVKKAGSTLDLSPTEFRLLHYLAERRGRVFTREQLLDSVWKGDAFVEPRTVDVHVRRLRTQIEDNPAEPRFIKTKRGVGYYFVEEA